MALGFGREESAVEKQDDGPVSDQSTFGKEGYYEGFSPDAGVAEGGGYPGKRKMSRIDRPVTKSISGSVTGRGLPEDDLTDTGVSVGKQMELEAGNAIKYRTCSWEKVWFLSFLSLENVTRAALRPTAIFPSSLRIYERHSHCSGGRFSSLSALVALFGLLVLGFWLASIRPFTASHC